MSSVAANKFFFLHRRMYELHLKGSVPLYCGGGGGVKLSIWCRGLLEGFQGPYLRSALRTTNWVGETVLPEPES